METMERLQIETLLHRLGVTANYTGHAYLLYGVWLCVQRQERLGLVTKWVYPQVAEQFGTNWKAAERNIRTVGSVIWRENPTLLASLAQRPLDRKPSSAQLLAILSSAVRAGR